jgi:ABC-type nitrate/sulfonate/bicarbonate transport system permease component
MTIPQASFFKVPVRSGGRSIERAAGAILQPLLSIGTLVLIWQLASSLGRVASLLLPSPLEVLAALAALALSGELWVDIAASVQRVVIGFSIAAVLAISLGGLLGSHRRLVPYATPVIEALRPIPPIAWIPLGILWFGLGNATSYFIVSIGAFFPIFTNTYAAVRSTDRIQLNAALSLGASRRLIFFDVLLPSALPMILTGLRVGLGIAWMSVVASELTAARSGLGYMMSLNRMMLRTDNVVAGMVAIGALGYVMNRWMLLLQDRLTPWRRGIQEP